MNIIISSCFLKIKNDIKRVVGAQNYNKNEEKSRR